MSDQMLPINATPAELAMEQATARVSGVPVLVRQSWDPDTCPVELLPWLASAFSVDEWDANWSEAQKRAAIAASVYVHRHKGTVGGIKRALGALEIDIDIVEWHQKTPKGEPYTFELQVNVDQGPCIPDQGGYDEAERIALAAKNVRSHLTGINSLLTSNGTEYFGGAAWCGEIVTVHAEPALIFLDENDMVMG